MLTSESKTRVVDRNTTLIESYIKNYSATGLPEEVSFRKILPELKNIDRLTHLIHTYPAKLLLHIPYFFINNHYFSKENDAILDPFCGTGTVLLESIAANRTAYGIDSNPLARLIAKVKTTPIPVIKLKAELKTLVRRFHLISATPCPDVVNIDYWFSAKVQSELSRLLSAIKEITDNDIRDFFLINYSNCIKKVSYADPNVSVPVRLNPKRFPLNSKRSKRIKERLLEIQNIDVIGKFALICNDNINRMSELGQLVTTSPMTKILGNDAREIKNNFRDGACEPVSLIITSPPYAGAQKYIRASSLSIGWLEMAKSNELKILDQQNIGRENYLKGDQKNITTAIPKANALLSQVYEMNPTRALICGNYLLEMTEALDEMIQVLKNDGFLIIIVGNNKVCGLEFNNQEYITDYLTAKGLRLMFRLIDDIKSYGLMTKRNKTADIISREWVLVFKKTKPVYEKL